MPIFGAKSRAARGCASKLACGRRIDPRAARPFLQYVAANLPLPNGRTGSSAPTGRCAWSPMARRNFVIASCRGERGIDPYGRITMLPFVARFCRCTVRGRGKPLPYVTTKHDTAQKKLPFSSSVTFGDSFPSKGSLGLLQTRQCSAIYFAQSMTCSLFSRKNVLIFENGWLPKKPR